MTAHRHSLLPVLAAVFAVLLTYLWIGTCSGTAPLYAMLDYHYYPLLADGFLAGQLSLPVEPKPELLQLPDPYDPDQNQPYRMHDLSLYHGKYYLFSGPAPALLAFVPWKALTGQPLPQYLAVLLFCSVHFLALTVLLRLITARVAPTTPSWFVALGVLALGFGTGNLHLLRWPSVYQVASAFNACLVALALLGLYFTLVSRRYPLLFLFLAALCLALSVGSRLHFALVALVVPLVALLGCPESRNGPPSVLRRLRHAALLLLPLGVVLMGLALYNQARFDTPFETGVRYQLGGFNLLHAHFWQVQNAFANFTYYLFQKIPFTTEFPYHEIRTRFFLRGTSFYQQECLYGLITGMPVCLSLLAPPALWTRIERPLRRFLGVTLLVGGLNFAFLLGFTSATVRYFSDFLTPLLLVATTLLVIADLQFAKDRSWMRVAFRTVVVAAVLYTVVIQLLLNFPSH